MTDSAFCHWRDKTIRGATLHWRRMTDSAFCHWREITKKSTYEIIISAFIYLLNIFGLNL